MGQHLLILGSTGMLGQALVQQFSQSPIELLTPSHHELDLMNQRDVLDYFHTHRPDRVIFAAALVGGIQFNCTHQADMGLVNGLIQLNVFLAAKETSVRQLLFIGSSCMYPRLCPQPMQENDLLSGRLEPTNELYALAKLYGTKLCQAFQEQHGCQFTSCIPCNLYGEGDKCHPENSHVIPSLFIRAIEAKQKRHPSLVIWGQGDARREFLHVQDLASALELLIERSDLPPLINIGSGMELSIAQLSKKICTLVGYEGELVFNIEKPAGMQQKLLDSQRIHSLGWSPSVSIEEGLKRFYHWYLKNPSQGILDEHPRALLSPSH